MKFLILGLCAVLATAKPHVYLYNGAVETPIESNGRVIDTPKIAEIKAAHLEAQGYPFKVVQSYQGPPAPLNEAGQVVDTPEVAQLKAERIAALEQATAAALAAAAAARPVHIEPLTTSRPQQVPMFMLVAPGFSSSYEHQYNGPQVTIGQHSLVVDREEVARMRAQYLAALTENRARDGTGFSNSITSSSGGYFNQADNITPQNQYGNPLPPVSEHIAPSSQTYSEEHTSTGTVVQQTPQLSFTRPADFKPECTEHETTTTQQVTSSTHANSQTVSDAATSSSSPTLGDNSYVEPASQQTHEFAVTQPQYNNLPTSTGGPVVTSPQSQPQELPHAAAATEQTQELSSTKPAEEQPECTGHETGTSQQVTSSTHVNSQTVADAATSSSSPTLGDNSYVEPASQQTHEFAVTQPQYNNLPTSTGGHVVTSPQSQPQELPHAVAAAEQTQELSPTKPVEEQPECTGHETATNQQVTSSTHVNSQTVAVTATPSSFPSTGVNSYQEPATQQTQEFVANNPEYSNLPASTGEHIASSSQSHSEADSYEGAANQQPQQLAVTNPSVINPQPINLPASTGQPVVPSPQSDSEGYSYPVPATQLSEEPPSAKPVAENPGCAGHESSSSEHDTTVPDASSRLANTAATPISSSLPIFLEIVPPPNFRYPQPFNKNQVHLLAQPQTRHFNAPTLSQAGAHRFNKIPEERKAATQVTNIAALNPSGSSVHIHVPVKSEVNPLKNNNHQQIVKHTVHSRPTYDGPLAPLDSNGNVIDTEEVAALKAEHLAILARANAQAIKLANAAKTRKTTPEPTYSSP